MRSSLRTITNVNIDGQVIDCVNYNHTLSFRVNCDSLSWVVAHYYDTEYGTMQGFHYPAYGTMTAKHNGETFNGSMWPVSAHQSPFLLGHDYTTIIYIFQNYPESVENPLNTGPGKYDVLLGSGRIKQSTSGNEAYIDPDITSYMNPQIYEDRLIGGCMIRINGTLYLIKSYNKSSGKITLGSSSTAEDISLSLSEGQQYYLVSNYIQCDPFTWYCRTDPTVTLTAGYSSSGIDVSGDYSQAEGVSMQYYQFSLDGEEGDRKFTYTFEDRFPLPHSGVSKIIRCETATQENHIKTVSTTLERPTYDDEAMTLTATEYTANRLVVLSVVPGFNFSEKVMFFVWRVCDNEDILIRVINRPGISGKFEAIDYTACKGKKYTYYVTAYYNDVLYIAQTDITVRSDIAKLMLLTEPMYASSDNYHRKRYAASSPQYFDVGAESGDISGSLGRTPVLTESGLPAAIISNDDYEQGTFTAYLDRLGDISEPIDSGLRRIETIRAFLKEGSIYLLLDNAGNARIITVTGVSRSFDHLSQMTKLSFGWTEIARLKDCLIE